MPNPTKISVNNVSLHFGSKQVLKDISLDINDRQIVALIGPSGCGKSTLLRCINRMHDDNDEAKINGQILINGKNIYEPSTNVHHLRKNVGMVFQKPNPFPKSIRDNISFGLRINGERNQKVINQSVRQSLEDSFLWDEVHDMLDSSALSLSGGQQQRLCIARCIAVSPEIILMDEPTSALDPIATQKIEELVLKLKDQFTIVIVTHNMQQAKRVADKVAMLYLGELIEYTDTKTFFTNPQQKLAKRYVSGEFG
jgi:phosphate transport system ATP-binding protein